ncbi:TonB-dependent receptor [Mucilaginibacter sp. BJC16-A38]|uniref:TonB-dependent receptor n=1 Tax=Mucilaginibacter phenanthrenivorans TaxID=1234842 RepID=UPI0021581DC6|nr:TonB-dependent receptor [Mucilaginibacter phenanthrenivorans]MCR8561245.1 TonB-dependent receptor [Mucilaginibacter phenanthrenivorans]
MKLKITAFLAAWLTIASTFVYAQQGLKISGKITGDGKPLDGATVYLKRAADSVLIKTALADASGNFVFENQKKGNYKLTVTMIGYQLYNSATFQLDSSKTLPTIALKQTGTTLQGVTITSQKPLIEHKIDRTVVNVDALISNAGSTALDVLEKSPGVLVDDNGAISLKGKGVQVFIDDKPSYLSGADLESYLRSLASSSIDQVELMSNPPAKYDAAGNGGIINIRTKKSKQKGFNGNLNLGWSQGKYGKTNNSFNYNYRNNKLNINGRFGYNTNNNFNDLDINRHFLNPDGSIASNFLQNSFIRRTSQSYSGKVEADYYASDKTTWGVEFDYMVRPSDENTIATSRLLNSQNVLDSTIIANNKQHYNFKNGGMNVNYRHQYDKNGKELSADFDYINYRNTSNQSFDNKTYLPDGTMVNPDLLTGSLPADIQIFALKADYAQPLRNGIKLAGGAKSSYTRTNNIADYFYTANDITTPDYTKTNHFIYHENINAAYINANKDFKRFSIQAGLRFENTSSTGHQLGNVQKPDSVFKRDYNALFPTLYLQYKLDTAGKQSISLNYGRRVDRPYYEDLNPFLSPIDKFTYYTGNPFLKPSYTNNVELSYTWGHITTEFSYSKTRDAVDETIEIVDGIYYSRPGNIGSTVNKTITIDASFEPAKWFNFHLFGFVQNIHTVSAFYTGTLDTKGTFFFIRPVTEFKLGNDWTAQLDGGYQSKITNAQFVAGHRGKVNTGLSKKLSPSTTVKLVVNDVFHTFVNSGDINNLANTLANYRNISDTRTAVISLSYRFGKTISDQRKHKDDASESEQNRVKN